MDNSEKLQRIYAFLMLASKSAEQYSICRLTNNQIDISKFIDESYQRFVEDNQSGWLLYTLFESMMLSCSGEVRDSIASCVVFRSIPYLVWMSDNKIRDIFEGDACHLRGVGDSDPKQSRNHQMCVRIINEMEIFITNFMACCKCCGVKVKDIQERLDNEKDDSLSDVWEMLHSFENNVMVETTKDSYGKEMLVADNSDSVLFMNILIRKATGRNDTDNTLIGNITAWISGHNGNTLRRYLGDSNKKMSEKAISYLKQLGIYEH